MFTKNMGRPMLASDIADRFFENITHGDVYMRDYSFVASIRAILANRVKEGQKATFGVRDASLSAEDIRRCSGTDLIKYVMGSRLAHDKLLVCNLSGRQEDNEAALAKLDETWSGNMPNYKEMNDLKAFVSTNMDARFYINETTHSTIIVVNRLTLTKYHFLQAMIPRYFPWFFKDQPLTDEERLLVKSCALRQPEEYERLIAVFASKFDLRKMQLKMLVGDFERSSRQTQIRRAEEELNRINSQITDNLNQYTRLIGSREDMNVRVEGLRCMLNKAEENSELLDYFECNRNLNPVETEGSTLKLIVRGYLNSFDPDNYECYARNFDSCYYSGYTCDRSEFRRFEDRKMLLDAIFSAEPKLKVRTCGYYSISLNGEVRAPSGYDFPSEYSDCFPNPHLYYNSCLGNHSRYIKEALLRGDMMTAITQCTSSVASVNVGESATMRPFVRDLFNGNRRCIEAPDGTMMTSVEALAWLKSQQTAA